MRFGLSILLTFVVSFATGLYFPFWIVGLVAFIIGASIYQKPVKAWLSGFVSIFLLWGLLAWWMDSQNDSILSHRMATLFPLGGSSFLLILITSIVGAIIGGLSALSGSFLRRYLDERRYHEEY